MKNAGLWDNFKKASTSSSNSTDSSLSPPKPVAPKINTPSPKSVAKPAVKPTPKPKPKPKPKAPSPKPTPKKVKTPAPVPNPTKKSPESDSDSDPEDIIPVKPTDVVPKVVPEVVLETRSIAVIYMEDIGTELERVRLLRNGVQQIYKLGLTYKGGNVLYRNLYKDDGELSIEGRCIIKEPNKMDIQWTI